MLDLTPQGSFALTSEMWLVHCTDQKACSHTQRSLGNNGKCSLLFEQLIHLDLPESRLQIQA